MDRTVYIAFVNNHFRNRAEPLIADLQQCLPFRFVPISLPLDLLPFYSGERNQYYSTLILARLLNFLPPDGNSIVGIVEVDIYVPIMTFLFGEAQLGGSGALVSTFRLRNEFYGLPENPALFYERVLKEVTHELGHVLGLTHCTDYTCVMHSSTYVEDIDLKRMGFCRLCQERLGIAYPEF